RGCIAQPSIDGPTRCRPGVVSGVSGALADRLAVPDLLPSNREIWPVETSTEVALPPLGTPSARVSETFGWSNSATIPSQRTIHSTSSERCTPGEHPLVAVVRPLRQGSRSMQTNENIENNETAGSNQVARYAELQAL